MTAGRATLVALLTPYLALGCTELPALGGDCGNGVIEAGEDCDADDPRCRPPGDALECRWDCSPIDDDERRACPAGYGCGLDDVCRAPSGSFDVRQTTTALTFRVSVGDLDGDRATDIVATELEAGVSAYFFDRDAVPVRKLPIAPMRFGPIEVGPLAGDRQPHALVLPDPRGASVYLGQTDRTLTTKSYASIPVPADELHYLVLEGLPQNPLTQDYAGAEILAFVPVAPDRSVLVDVFGGGKLFEIELGLEAVRSGVLAADFDQTTPCDELAVAASGAQQIELVSLCRPSKAGWLWKLANNRSALPLPPDYQIAPLEIDPEDPDRAPPPLLISGDVDGDGHLDLLLQAERMGTGTVLVGYGAGDGSFHSKPIGPDSFSVFDALPALTPGILPLAVGNLTDDGILDGVTRSGVVWSTTGDSSCSQAFPGYDCALTSSSKAIIRDLNRDSIPDVVTLDSGGLQVEYFSGTGSGFVRHSLPANGLIRDFLLGDFDGDLLTDIALHELAFTGSHAVSILFGKPFGRPEPALPIAKFPEVMQIGAGRFSFGPLDQIDDLGILSKDNSVVGAALLSGSPDRRMQSPYTLFLGDDLTAAARAVVIGQFDADETHADLAVLSSGVGLAQPPSGPPVDPATRLWLLPSNGQADIDDAMRTFSEPLDQNFVWCAAILVPIDLGGTPAKELVILGPRPDLAGKLLVASVDGNQRFAVNAAFDLPEIYGDGFALIGCPGEAAGDGVPPLSATAVADIDGDGDEDLLAIGFVPTTSREFEARVFIYRNDGSGTLDPGNRIALAIPIEPGQSLTGFAVIEADGDPLPELVITTAPFDFDPERSGGGVHLVDFDPGSGELRSFTTLVGGPWLAVVAGDFDGNGVADFAATGLQGLLLGTGRAVLP